MPRYKGTQIKHVLLPSCPSIKGTVKMTFIYSQLHTETKRKVLKVFPTCSIKDDYNSQKYQNENLQLVLWFQKRSNLKVS